MFRTETLSVCCPLLLSRSSEKVGLDLGVEDEDQGAAGASDDVGEGTLEEGLHALLLRDLDEAVPGAGVLDIGALLAGHHHQASADTVKWVGDDTSRHSHELSEAPHGEEVGLLGVWEQYGLASVEHAEVGSAVSNNADNGDAETSVETLGTIGHGDLSEAVNEASEFTSLAGADIGGETSSAEVKWIDDRQ